MARTSAPHLRCMPAQRRQRRSEIPGLYSDSTEKWASASAASQRFPKLSHTQRNPWSTGIHNGTSHAQRRLKAAVSHCCSSRLLTPNVKFRRAAILCSRRKGVDRIHRSTLSVTTSKFMKKTVFWSWQSDLSPAVTKNFIRDALAQALEKVTAELQLEMADRLELDHDTKGEAGLVEIVSTIFKKIEDCQIFVADITPITAIVDGTTETKKVIPNPNVMLELGYAMREVGPQRVITVANLAFGGKPEEMPFDLRHRRGAITYHLKDAKDPSIERIRKDLIRQLVAALTTNLAAPREDQVIRNPMPVLSITAAEGVPDVFIVHQDVQLSDVPSLADIKTKTPLKTKEQQNGPASPMELLSLPPVFPGSKRRKPFKEWTEDELRGYNMRAESYYHSYVAYLESLREYRLLKQRAVTIHLVVSNDGTRPATDVRAFVTFPEGILVYENDDLPKAPEQPDPPPFVPNGWESTTIVSPYPSYRLSKPERIAADHRSISFNADKIQQRFHRSIEQFTIVMNTQADIRPFEASYQIFADELPQRTTGTLRFEVRQADGIQDQSH